MSRLRRIGKVVLLAIILLRELWLSAVSVARSVLARDREPRSAIVAMPLDLRTDAGIVTLANCITLTPGTTSLHVSADRRILYVHALDAGSADEVIAGIRSTFEDRIREIEG